MPLKIGDPMPFLRIATLGGTSFALDQLGGRPAVIFLWGSWHPSRQELPALRARAAVGGPPIVTIAVDAQGPGIAMRYLKGPPAPWITLIDSFAIVSRFWGIKALPATLLVDAHGRLQQIAARPDDALLAAAARLPRVDPPAPWKRAQSLEACPPEVEVLFQECGSYLSRKRTQDATGFLKQALALDPGNELIAGQIEALLHPERVYANTSSQEPAARRSRESSPRPRPGRPAPS